MKILITGGSGFLGICLAKALSHENEVWLGARNQKRLFEAAHITGTKSRPLDCSSIHSVRDVIGDISPHVVIHAAATKYVDWSEKYPLDTVDINILGSQNILRACKEYGVQKLIGISTDKAAPPIANIYGLSKSVMERMFLLEALKDLSPLQICCVRYGNVLWSTGSFLPVWKEMVAENNHIITTGSTMTRFFFSVEEAVDLVLTVLRNTETLNGKLLSLPMKTACVRQFLDIICAEKGCSFTISESRPGERHDEYLVGEAELSFSKEISLGGKELYSITPNSISDQPILEPVCSSSSPSHSNDSIFNYLQPFF